MAEVLGTSHRMLIYYFGSADGFWEALLCRIRHAEQRVRPALAEEAADPARVLELAGNAIRPTATCPSSSCCSRSMAAPSATARFQAFLDDVVGSWMGAMADRLHRQLGLPPAEARLRARVELATMRGLLLDLVTTGDRKGTTAALKYFAERLAPAPR